MNDEAEHAGQRMPTFLDMRLLPPTVSAWALSWWATGGNLSWSGVLLGALGLCAAAAAFTLWQRWEQGRRPQPRHSLLPSASVRLTLAVSFIAAAGALLLSHNARAAFDGDPFRAALASHHTVDCEVEITGYPRARGAGSSTQSPVTLPARTLSIYDEEGRALASSVEIRLRGKGVGALQRGDHLRVRVTAAPRQRLPPPVAAEVTLLRLISRHPAEGVAALPAKIRSHTQVLLHETTPHTRGLIPGLAMGDRSGLTPRLNEAMRAASLSHLSAISGMHIAVVLGAMTLIVPGRGLLRVSAVIVTLGVIVLLAGPTASVLRSVTMAGVGLWGLIARRPGQALTGLSAVSLALLYGDPWNGRSYAFALSVLATAGVVTLGQRWQVWARKHLRGDTIPGSIARTLHGLLAVPLAAQLWATPVLLMMDPHVPLWGVVANVLVAPVLAPATILALGVCLSAPLSPAFAQALIVVAEPLCAWIAEVALRVAALPSARLPWLEGIDGALLWIVCVLSLWGGIKVVARMGHWKTRPTRPRETL